MKKFALLLAVLLVFLCGCSTATETEEEANAFTLPDFSFDADYASYANQPGVEISGFRHSTVSSITGLEQLMDLARDECTIDFDTITTSYDGDSQIYKFTFTLDEAEEPSNEIFEVYINNEGVTKMTVYREKE